MERKGRSKVSDKSRKGDSPGATDRPDVAAMVESIVGCKWSVRILGLLADGCHRPSALMRQCPGLTAKVMNERLRKLMRFGIAERVVHGEKPPVEVEYLLTPFGQHFLRLIDDIRQLQEAVDREEVL